MASFSRLIPEQHDDKGTRSNKIMKQRLVLCELITPFTSLAYGIHILQAIALVLSGVSFVLLGFTYGSCDHDQCVWTDDNTQRPYDQYDLEFYHPGIGGYPVTPLDLTF